MEIRQCAVEKCYRMGDGIDLPPKMAETVAPTGVLSPEAASFEAGRCLGNQVCNDCGVCVPFCPDGCMSVRTEGGIAIDYVRCKGCGICAAVCPKGAIEMVVEEIEE
jgi:2-oxoacid:acceptor oxidoreductase delta subunit (pyruvate/2-ketoisovalerate family)